MDKKHILEEIKRTAKTNGGVPLGSRRFFTETGISKSDWFGKHWARWGEAVRDAGHVPNQLRRAYDQDWLIEKFIYLTREIGRIPVQGDVLMKVRNDRSFPNYMTFTNRLGSKSQLIAKITRYCRKHKDFEDVLPLLESYASDKSPPADDDAESAEPSGFVYLLQSGHSFKIGRSNAFGRREREFAIQLPETPDTVHVIRTDDPVGVEAYWHKRFETKRKGGEWFELDASDIKAFVQFRRRKFM